MARKAIIFVLAISLLAGLWEGCHRVKRPHDRAALHNNQGVVYLKRKEYDKALQEFKIAVELSPDYADAHHNMGVLYEQTGDLKNAEASYLKATKADYSYGDPYNGLCSVYYRLNRYDDAISMGKKALKKNPTLADAAYCIGLNSIRLKDMEQSEKFFRKASDLDPNHYLAHNALGKTYLSQGKYDDALNRFKVAVEVYPSFEEGWQNLGFTYYQKGELSQAERAEKAALGINTRNKTSHKYLAAILMKQANTEPIKRRAYCSEAVNELRVVTNELDRFDGEALANLGLAERCMAAEEASAKNADLSRRWMLQAERTLKRAVEVEPEQCMAYLFLGELQLDDLKNETAGLSSLQEALNCTKKSKKPLPLALFKMGSYQIEHGKTAEGKRLLCEFLSSADPKTQTDLINRARAATQSYGGC